MIAPGTILQNRYLVEEQIGQGGMGAVYIATDQRFGSRVALKKTFFVDPNLRKAFEREAKLLNRLRHHALPRVSDHFVEGEGQFLVMEYIEGDDLSHLLAARGGFALRDVLNWADQLLDALDYLHTQEHPVIHRDIKPQNLKLTSRNQILLLDFGLAKGTPLQSRVTNSGSVLGYSLNYAPLEQMQGTGTDPRSDIYSLGATLYHLMTAATPPDALTRATAVLNGDDDPLRPANELNPQIPESVAAVITKAMSQSAGRRYASAEEMRQALKDALKEANPAGAPSPIATLVDQFAVTQASEQATQLLGSEEGGQVTSGMHAPKQTEFAGLRSDSTFVEGKSATAEQASDAGVAVRDSDSVVTSVGHRPVENRRARSRRAIGIGGGIAALVLVAVAVYAFTRRDAQPPQTPVESITVLPAQTPEATPSMETLPPVAATPTPDLPPVPPKPSSGSAGQDARTRRSANTAGTSSSNQVNGNLAQEAREPQETNGNVGISQEELQAMLQRAAEERQRVIRQRRAIERERRRRRALRTQPPPTYP
jgi:serine/threonine protein kinase